VLCRIFLTFAGEVIFAATHLTYLIVSQFAPIFTRRAFELFPIFNNDDGAAINS
jgi:hypothetical protein